MTKKSYYVNIWTLDAHGERVVDLFEKKYDLRGADVGFNAEWNGENRFSMIVFRVHPDTAPDFQCQWRGEPMFADVGIFDIRFTSGWV
jgi:hypothetical protein